MEDRWKWSVNLGRLLNPLSSGAVAQSYWPIVPGNPVMKCFKGFLNALTKYMSLLTEKLPCELFVDALSTVISKRWIFSRITVTPDGVLWIYNISRADEGKYTCFAENYLGKANSTGHLSVRGNKTYFCLSSLKVSGYLFGTKYLQLWVFTWIVFFLHWLHLKRVRSRKTHKHCFFIGKCH